MNNEQCKIRSEILNVKSDEPTCYSVSIKTSKCIGSCNIINDPYAKMCVPDVVKNFDLRVFNLLLRANETTGIKWHANVDQMQVFVIINIGGIMINVDVKAKS